MSTLPYRRSLAAFLAAALLAPAAFAQGDTATETTGPAEPAPLVVPETPATPTPLATPATPKGADVTVERSGTSEENATATGTSDRAVFVGGRVVDVNVTAPDVFAAAESLNVKGNILDNLHAIGRNVSLDSTVGGDAFLMGETLTLSQGVSGDLYAAGETLRIPSGVSVGGNVYWGGGTLDLDGTIGGSLLGAGANFDLDGDIGGDVKLEAAKLDLGADASIGGVLDYRSPQEGTIADGADVGGAVTWTEGDLEDDWEGIADTESDGGFNLGWHIFLFLGALLIGGAFLGLFPRALVRPAEVMEEEAPVALGVGFAVLLGVPILAVFLMMFVLPIPLSLLALAVYVPATFVARFVTAYVVGGFVVEKLGWSAKPIGALLAGLTVLHIGYAIPILGALIGLISTVLGLGALFLVARRSLAPAAG